MNQQINIPQFETLSQHQLKPALILAEYFGTGHVNKNPVDFVVLEGYAGTGKTYTLNRVIDLASRLNISISAPTHKAVKVLKKNSERPRDFQFATIHSLLGLTQKISEKGIVSYEVNDFSEKRIVGTDVLIVDEVSMLDPKLFHHLMSYKKENPNLRIVFTGDPLQIPPVGEKQSYVFTEEACKNRSEEHTSELQSH